MSARDYNKLYINSDRKEGSEKLLLGYKQDSRDVVLKKDRETYFHVPYFLENFTLHSSSLIAEGAVGGPFPAAADRIYKDQKNYGNVTEHGTSSGTADGTWFCSWLYKNELGKLLWMDRMYNPGKFKYSIAYEQMFNDINYESHNPIFRDVVSKMIFDPGVRYRYFHVGEQTAAKLVETLGGVDKERLVLDLSDWGSSRVNKAETETDVNIISKTNNEKLYINSIETNRIEVPVINLDHSNETDISVNFDESLNLTNEFTLSFDAKSNNWFECPTTQLAGNLTSRGGYGLFVQSLSSFPFMVISETTYGHLLYVNDKPAGFADKSVRITAGAGTSAVPEFISIDFDQNVIVVNNDGSNSITKFDNAGKVIATASKDDKPFVYSDQNEIPLQTFCGRDDTFVVLTNKKIYYFDIYLNNINSVSWNVSQTTKAAYKYNIENDSSNLTLIENSIDAKFIQTQLWTISSIDGNLYRKNDQDPAVKFANLPGGGTNIAIDPLERVWVLHGNNEVSVFNPLNTKLLGLPLKHFIIGENLAQKNKNISFFCQYNHSTKKHKWFCAIYYSDDANLFILDLEGNLQQVIGLTTLFNPKTTTILKESSEKFTFLGKGDFTGYENKRVFGKLSPYKEASQLVLRASLKNKSQNNLTFRQFKTFASMKDWNKSSWQRFTITLKNRTFSVFLNTKKVLEMNYSGQYELSYEMSPSFYIGTSGGSQSGFNKEIRNVSYIFNGLFGDVKLYNYAIEPKMLEMFVRRINIAQDIYWSMPTPNTQYVEQIDHFFKHKLPGAKSQFYNIKIAGSKIQDTYTRLLIEERLRQLVIDIQPASTDLLNIIWID